MGPLRAARIQRVSLRPPHVLLLCVKAGAGNRLAAPGGVALIEHPQKIGFHKASDFSQIHDQRFLPGARCMCDSHAAFK
jgi:hypothetical protein